MKKSLLAIPLFLSLAALARPAEIFDPLRRADIPAVKTFPRLTGPYLGQKPPGLTPEIFAPGIVSTDVHEFSCAFSPDGKYLFFTSGEQGRSDIYWVSAEVIKGLKSKTDR